MGTERLESAWPTAASPIKGRGATSGRIGITVMRRTVRARTPLVQKKFEISRYANDLCAERLTPPCLSQVPLNVAPVQAEMLVRQLCMLITPSQQGIPYLPERLCVWPLALNDLPSDRE